MAVRRSTLILKIDPRRPDRRMLAYCGMVVREGGLVVFPTETVYGIAANFLDPAALGRLYAVKKRSRGKPFTVHIADEAMVAAMGCALSGRARRLARAYWPGPLTMVLASKYNATIGFRMPRHRVALGLIEAARVPVVAPSANLSGRTPPTSAAGALRDLDGKVDIVLDAGPTTVGVASTVVDLTGGAVTILREGAITAAAIGKRV